MGTNICGIFTQMVARHCFEEMLRLYQAHGVFKSGNAQISMILTPKQWLRSVIGQTWTNTKMRYRRCNWWHLHILSINKAMLLMQWVCGASYKLSPVREQHLHLPPESPSPFLQLLSWRVHSAASTPATSVRVSPWWASKMQSLLISPSGFCLMLLAVCPVP